MGKLSKYFSLFKFTITNPKNGISMLDDARQTEKDSKQDIQKHLANSLNLEKSNKIFNYLKKNNIDAIIDDTEENISAKIKKFNLIGIPYQLIIGSKSEVDFFEFKEIGKETQKLKVEEIAKQINKIKSN